jgi:hypothetical protein
MSQLISEPYEYNTSLTAIFSKLTVRIRLDANIRTIVVLTGVKLIGIYFLHLLSVMTHRRQGKKLSILPLGDVNLKPIPSRRYLLEDNPYRVVGVQSDV